MGPQAVQDPSAGHGARIRLDAAISLFLNTSMKADDKRFTVIIVNRNGGKTLDRVVSALQQAVQPNQDDIFVVDNASHDESMDIIERRHPNIRTIRNSCNLGFAAANNQAIDCANSRYVLLLNNDAFVPPDILVRMAAAFEGDSRRAVIGGQLYTEDGREQRSSAQFPTALGECGLRLFQKKPPLLPAHGVVEVDAVVGACMAVRRKALLEVGTLDEDFFFYFEDIEWCHRFRQAGWTTVLDRDCHVVHLKGKSTRSSRPEAQIEMLRSRWLYYRKTFSPSTALLLTTWRLVRLIVNSFFHLLAVIATLGLNKPVRKKCYIYCRLLVWCLAGCPKSWGLPDKCPD